MFQHYVIAMHIQANSEKEVNSVGSFIASQGEKYTQPQLLQADSSEL